MRQLEDIGYAGFAFAFLEEDLHFVGTTNTKHCAHPKFIQYLVSLITAGMNV